MVDILDKIKAYKLDEIEARKAKTSLDELKAQIHDADDKVRNFIASLETHAHEGYALIAEIKKASPSKGVIREDFSPEDHARAYEAAGAACLSVLTDYPSFQGKEDYLIAARNAVKLPVLRKDFMFDIYQIYESRAIGADCILLIMAALEDGEAAALEAVAFELGMSVLIEVHNEEEIERAALLNSNLIGINNRDLRSFKTDIETTRNLMPYIPADTVIVSESGLNTPDDLRQCAEWGVRNFLIGESLMREPNVELATKKLLANPWHVMRA